MHVIGTAGHVDHGKSTLVQRLTGMDPDRFAEEKRRGLTIDLGFAWFTLPSGNEVGIVDVPGHERFVRNMLAGAGGITVCLFVVAANEGWKPQSAEHLAILDLLGVRHGVVALTKADTVDEPGLEAARHDVSERLSGTTLEEVEIVACSGATGAGIDELVRELDRVVQDAPPPQDRGRPRMWVDRVFTIAGAGTVVTGTTAGGTFAVGDHVEIAPEGRTARIRGVQSHKRQVETIGPGNRTALNLAGLERQGAERGDAIVQPGAWAVARIVDARLRVLVDAAAEGIADKGAWVMHAGSAETPVRLKVLGGDRIDPGSRGFVQLHLAHPLPLTRGDRFVLRDVGRVRTVAGGIVLDPLATPTSRTDDDRIQLLQRLEGTDDAIAAQWLARERRQVPVAELLNAYGIERDASTLRIVGDIAVAGDRVEELAGLATHAVEAHHRAQPLERGLPLSALRAQLDVGPELFEAALGQARDLVRVGDVVKARHHAVGFSPADQTTRAGLLARLHEAGYEPPMTSELGVDPALLRALVENGDLVRIGTFHLTSAQADEAKRKVALLILDKGEGVTVAEIRDHLGTTRKYAVPLSEWLDSEGVTRRKGDLRILGPRSPH